MAEKGLVKASSAELALAESGLDFEKEMEQFDDVIPSPPRIKVEHSKSGRHRMYLSMGESYENDETEDIDIPDNVLHAQVVDYQNIRAMFENDEDLLPVCAAVNGIPTVSEPKNSYCNTCSFNEIGTKCKPKVRLFLLAKIDGDGDIRDADCDSLIPCVFPLSPTSIKHWKKHLKKMKNTGQFMIGGKKTRGTPPILFPHKFSLEDVKKAAFRWAEVIVDIDKQANSSEMIRRLAELRKTLTGHSANVTATDFSDPGDKPIESAQHTYVDLSDLAKEAKSPEGEEGKLPF